MRAARVSDVFRPSRRAIRRSKYGNRTTIVNGQRFASRKEAARYVDLCWLEKAGKIEGLRCQPRYPLVWNGVKITTYVADFEYFEHGIKCVEDVKSPATARLAGYRYKKNMMLACYGITVRET